MDGDLMGVFIWLTLNMSPHVVPGGALFIEQRWTIEDKRADDILVIFVLTQQGQVLLQCCFSTCYRWHDMSEWDTDETIR